MATVMKTTKMTPRNRTSNNTKETAGGSVSRQRGLMVAASVSLAALVLGASLAAPRSAQAGGEPAKSPALTAFQGAPLTTANIRETETEAGNIVADAVRAAAGAEIAFVPAAAFRPQVSLTRPVTGESAAGLVEPATDAVVVLSLRGAQVLAALERAVSFAPQPSAGFLQVSGVRFVYDASKPGGKRVTSATVGGAALDAARVYKVATTKPLANGQQGYFQIWDKDQISGDSGKTLASALAEFGKSRGGALTVPVDGRITRTDK